MDERGMSTPWVVQQLWEREVMPWVRIDDHMTEHPKLLSAGPLALAMQVAGLCYCNRELTDGFIPRAKARSLLDWSFVRADAKVYQVAVTCGMTGDDVDCQFVIDVLVECGMWDVAEGGYRIHDYHDYQPSREQVEEFRQASARRQMEWRTRNAVTNTARNAVTNTPSNSVTNDVSHSVINTPVTHAPVPVIETTTLSTPNVVDNFVAKKSKPTKAVKSAIPDNLLELIPQATWVNMRDEQHMSSDELRLETAKMIDHFRSKGEWRVDWVAAWRNWMRSNYRLPRGAPTNGRAPRGMTNDEIAAYVTGGSHDQDRDGENTYDAQSRVVE